MRGVTTFGAFTTARLGILASQKALDVTGHNISNINTVGYTRQALDQISLRTGGHDMTASVYASNIGSGVLPISVSQLRDPYLDIRFRNENASVGFMSGKLNGLQELKNIIDEVSKGDGSGEIEAQFNDFMKQLKGLEENPTSSDYQSLARTSASTLVKLFNSYSKQLADAKGNQEAQLDKQITAINNTLSKLRELNDSIIKSEVHGDNALELRDERNLLLDELSQYMKIDVTYEQVDMGAGTTVDKLVVKTAKDKDGNQRTLVDGGYAAEFSLRPQENPAHADDPTLPKYLDKDGNPTDNIKDAATPNFNIDLGPLTNAKGKVLETGDPPAESVKVELTDTELYGSLQAVREMLTELGEFTPKSVVDNTDPDYDPALYDPNAATKRGIPYYQTAMDALARKFATLMNEANNGYMYNSDGNYVGNDGKELQFLQADGTRKPMSNTDAMSAEQKEGLERNGVKLGGNLFSIDSTGDNAEGVTAGNISISKRWAAGMQIQNSYVMDSQLGADGHPLVGSSANENILHIMYVMDAKYEYTPGEVAPGAVDAGKGYCTGSFQEFLTSVQNTLGQDYQDTSTLLDNYYATATNLDVSREGVSGVDLNDEAMSMMQYQKSYSAACRMMTTVDEILDKLINGTGIVGR